MFSTGGFEAKIESEKEVTIDELVSEADQIWATCRKRKLTFGDLEAAEHLLNEMRKDHPQFSKSYPIVLRYICQMQEYSTKAFKLYLIKIKQHPWKSEAEYLDSQADYVVMLYKAKHRKYNITEVNALRKNVRTMLQNEHEVFTAKAKQISEEVDQEEVSAKQRKNTNLRDWYAQHGENCIDIKLRTETDMPSGNFIDVDSAAQKITSDEPTSISADSLLE